ncbi:MAG TPA: alpha/beta hydrolase [Vicinamibacterales bacterium]|nr:alpha/beta hydrolase [Vicinamibacterales bacterium]
MRPVAAWRLRLELAGALVLLFLAVWTRWPVPFRVMFGLSVAVPEIAHWLLAVGVVIAAAAIRDWSHRPAKFALAAIMPAFLLLGAVLFRLPTAIRTFDEAFRSALGPDYDRRFPADVRDRLRPSPIAFRDLIRGLDGDGVTVKTGVTYAIQGGEAVTLTVYRPGARGPLPVVVQFHGGNWPRTYGGFEGAITRALSASGYLVFDVDYRPAPRWHWPAQMEDVTAALDWIAAHASEHGGDPSQLILVGRSIGGLLALRAAAARSAAHPRAVVALYCPVDLLATYQSPPVPDILDVRGRSEAFLGGTPQDVGDLYRDLSPIAHAGRPHPPVLLINGAVDPVVRPGDAERLAGELRASGVTVLLVLPWANHGFDQIAYGPSIQITLYYMERFLAWALSEPPA